jgi:hypothetical protein
MSAAGRTRILGIDPGTLRLGYGVIDRIGKSKLTYVECGVISAPARQPRDQRLLTIGRGLRELLDELCPDEVALEQAFYGKNVQATLALGEARGVALFVAGDRGLSVVGCDAHPRPTPRMRWPSPFAMRVWGEWHRGCSQESEFASAAAPGSLSFDERR